MKLAVIAVFVLLVALWFWAAVTLGKIADEAREKALKKEEERKDG